jgi:hypothetical protein
MSVPDNVNLLVLDRLKVAGLLSVFYGGVLRLRELPRNKALQGRYTLIWYELLDIQLNFLPHI